MKDEWLKEVIDTMQQDIRDIRNSIKTINEELGDVKVELARLNNSRRRDRFWLGVVSFLFSIIAFLAGMIIA